MAKIIHGYLGDRKTPFWRLSPMGPKANRSSSGDALWRAQVLRDSPTVSPTWQWFMQGFTPLTSRVPGLLLHSQQGAPRSCCPKLTSPVTVESEESEFGHLMRGMCIPSTTASGAQGFQYRSVHTWVGLISPPGISF